MTEDLIRVRLFLLSYTPLWLILLTKSYPSGKWKWHHQDWIFISLAIWTLISLLQGMRLIIGTNHLDSRKLFFGNIDDEGGNAAGYLATYLLPFLGLSPSSWRDWTAYGLYFLSVATIYIRTDLVLVNPILYLFDYRVVSANEYEDDENSRGKQKNKPRVIIVCRRNFRFSDGKTEVANLVGGYVVKKDQNSY